MATIYDTAKKIIDMDGLSKQKAAVDAEIVQKMKARENLNETLNTLNSQSQNLQKSIDAIVAEANKTMQDNAPTQGA